MYKIVEIESSGNIQEKSAKLEFALGNILAEKYEMSIFYSASGASESATVTSSVLAAASIIGVPVSIVLASIGGVMTGYATHVGNCYRDAYNYFMDRISKSGTYYMRTITAFGFITGVTTGEKIAS